MSETTNPSALVEQVSMTVEDASVIPAPVDPTLSHEGEAADAKATGDAIAGVLDGLKVNNKTPVGKEFTVYGSDIALTDDAGAQTVAEAVQSLAEQDADDIMYDATNLVTVADALDAINTALESELSTGAIDAIFDAVFGGDD